MRLHCCWLSAACITAINALTVTFPPPNSTLGVGSEFLFVWEFNQSVSPTLLVTISLLSSPSVSDVVTALASTEEENGQQWIVINHAQPNSAYYLSLNDTISPTVVAGPYYFSNSSNVSIPQSSSISPPSNNPTSQSFQPYHPSQSSRLILTIIVSVIAGLLLISCVVFRCGIYKTFRRNISRSANSSDSNPDNEPGINQEQSQVAEVTEVNHTSHERLTSEVQVNATQVNSLAILSNTSLAASQPGSASAHSTDDNAYIRFL